MQSISGAKDERSQHKESLTIKEIHHCSTSCLFVLMECIMKTKERTKKTRNSSDKYFLSSPTSRRDTGNVSHRQCCSPDTQHLIRQLVTQVGGHKDGRAQQLAAPSTPAPRGARQVAPVSPPQEPTAGHLHRAQGKHPSTPNSGAGSQALALSISQPHRTSGDEGKG